MANKHGPGATALGDWMGANSRRTCVAVGEALNVTGAAVGSWLRGVAPSEPLRRAIEALTGIPASTWATRAEVRQEKRRQKCVERARASLGA